MTPTARSSPQANPDNNSLASLVLLWCALQLAAITLSASGVALWARPDRPVELLAPNHLLAVQIVACALLFPWLLGDWRRAVVTALTGTVMLQLAGLLSGATSALPWWFAALSMWIAALWSWSCAIRGWGLQHAGICFALMLLAIWLAGFGGGAHIGVGGCGLLALGGIVQRIAAALKATHGLRGGSRS